MKTEAKLTPAQQRVIDYLDKCEYSSEKLIARHCFNGPTAVANMTRTTEALERRKLIQRRYFRSPRYGVSSYGWEIVR